MTDKNYTIPIAYSTDDNYAMPVAVSIKSILFNSKNKDLFFIILYKNKLSEKSKRIIDLSICGTNSKIEYIDIKDSITDVYLPISHISECGYYRFVLPDMLIEYDKCVYLDGDTILKKDITCLINEELNSNYIAAVRCESLLDSVFTYRHDHMKELGIDSLSHYINSGVLILNLKELREHKLSKKMIEMINNKYSIQDQDIYSVACYGKIKLLDPKYNVVPGILEKTIMELKNAYTAKQIKDARNNPVIIHFADKQKPWNYYGMKYGDEWDKYYNMLFEESIDGRKKYFKSTFIKRNITIIKNGFKYIYKKVFNKVD